MKVDITKPPYNAFEWGLVWIFDSRKNKSFLNHVAKHRCDFCGNLHGVLPSRIINTKIKNHYCSTKCQRNYRTKYALQKIRKCETCSKEFTADANQVAKNHGKYCSRKCYFERGRINRNCFHCNNIFTICKSNVIAREGKFCSQACYKAHRQKQRKFVNRKEGQRQRAQYRVITLHETYIKYLLVNGTKSLCKEDIPQELIELKRAHLTLKREIKNAQKHK